MLKNNDIDIGGCFKLTDLKLGENILYGTENKSVSLILYDNKPPNINVRLGKKHNHHFNFHLYGINEAQILYDNVEAYIDLIKNKSPELFTKYDIPKTDKKFWIVKNQYSKFSWELHYRFESKSPLQENGVTVKFFDTELAARLSLIEHLGLE